MSQDYLEIKNYSFQKDIGEGNFGKVKLGIFKPTGEEFAIKILNKSKIRIKMKNSIFKENEIITRFNHINVVYVFQILEDSQNFYIIMEYCKHGELFDYIVKNEKLSEDESSIFFYQLINGIEYIHSKGISHRDLKPENLLLAENKILKIIDFGLSHEFEGDELLKTKCGSPSYAAPEIICCPFYDGFKVDVWCCGIILYAMLCGYLPFEGEDNNILFQNILNCAPDFPPFLSDLSKDIILKILNPDPEIRITIDGIKKHSFYLKGKQIFEKKQEAIIFNERMSNYFSNNLHYKGSYKDVYLKNFLSRNNNRHINNNQIINLFRSKYYDTKEHLVTSFENQNNKILTTTNNKAKNTIKNEYLATETNNNKLNTDNFTPLNIKLINSAKKGKIKQDYNDYYENNLTKKDDNENEKIKNITNILPYRENKYNLINNLFNLYKKKEKSTDLHKDNKIFSNKKSINTDLNFNSPNKRPLLLVKKYSSPKKNNKKLYENNPLFNDININKTNFKMNDKLIINLTNNEEKNNSLLRINKKIQSLDKYMNLNGSFKNLNTRLKTDFKNNDNFPIINRPRNGNIFSPKIERRYGDKTDRKYFFNNLFNLGNSKDKDNLNYFFNAKNINLSPTVKI